MVQTSRSDLIKVVLRDERVPVRSEGGRGHGTVLVSSKGPFVDDRGVEGIEQPGSDEWFLLRRWL
jgi:hypothetical protein